MKGSVQGIFPRGLSGRTLVELAKRPAVLQAFQAGVFIACLVSMLQPHGQAARPPVPLCRPAAEASRLQHVFGREIARRDMVILGNARSGLVQIAAGRLFAPGSDEPLPEGRALLHRLAMEIGRGRCVVHLRTQILTQAPRSDLFRSAGDLGMARAEEASEIIRDSLSDDRSIPAAPVLGPASGRSTRDLSSDWLELAITPRRE
jgi:hypothetical protein